MRKAILSILTAAALLLAGGTAAQAAISGGPQKVADINGDVTTQQALPGGLLAIGGSFTRVSGQPVGNLAVINPLTGAVAYRGNLDGVPWAMTYLNGKLYVGGDFSQRALAFNTSNWTRAAWNPQTGVGVKALERAAGRVYVATASRVYSTDPVSGAHHWSVRTNGNPGATGPVRSLLAAAGHLYIGGQFKALIDDQGHGQLRPGLQAVGWDTGVIDFSFQPVLRPETTPGGFQGDHPLVLRYDAVLGRLLAGMGSASGNHLRSFLLDGRVAEIDILTTGDVQAAEVIRHGTGATSYFAGWHNQHQNEPTRFFGAEADPRTGTWSAFNPGLSGVMAGSAGNDGVESSALSQDGQWLFAGGSFTSPYPGLVRYRIT